MHPRFLVLARYPEANATRRGFVYLYGARGAYRQRRWVIRADASLDGEFLGQGLTEDAAWYDAVKHLTRVRRSTVPIRRPAHVASAY